jgi:hypothetical protein
MVKLFGWRNRLKSYASASAREPFAYGRHDCALFAAGAVEAMTGHDPAADWRGRYTTLLGGLRVIRKSGHDDHIAAAAAWFAEIPPAKAQVGDLAVVAGDDGPALGVVAGPHVWVLRPDGLGTVPLTMAERAFRV